MKNYVIAAIIGWLLTMVMVHIMPLAGYPSWIVYVSTISTRVPLLGLLIIVKQLKQMSQE